MLPSLAQPSAQTISAELDAYARWGEAYRANAATLPDLPDGGGSPSTPLLLWGAIARGALVCLGWVARSTNLRRLREWAAVQLVRLDFLALDRLSCHLNHAWTELGLAVSAQGRVSDAVECLERSWRVHPCGHLVSFGLDVRLWTALAGIPDAEQARMRYAEIARRFCSDFALPRPNLTPRDFLRAVLKPNRRHG